MLILLHVFIASAYLGLAWKILRRIVAVEHDALASSLNQSLLVHEQSVLCATWLAHGALLGYMLFAAHGLHFGFAQALSVTMWLSVAVYWIESFFVGLAGMALLVLSLTAICLLLPLWFSGNILLIHANGLFEIHLVVALAAYGLLTLAALHALLMARLERWLHPQKPCLKGKWLQHWKSLEHAILSRLPPLLAMERLLFRVLAVGFGLLTLTVITGVIFSQETFGHPLRFEHKIIFTLISWLIFAVLLLGRQVYGWRGRFAVRCTLAGFVMMLLAYVGSHFVLEVVLHRF